MWPFDSGPSGWNGSVGSGGSLTIDDGEGTTPQTFTADPGNFSASQPVTNSSFNWSGLGNALSGVGGLGAKLNLGQQQTNPAQATPASDPKGGGGPILSGLINMLMNPGAPPPMPATGQPAPYMGPQAPLGPGAQNPLLMMLLHSRLGG